MEIGSIRCFCICDKTPVAVIAVYGSVKDAFEGMQLQNATIPELNTYSLQNSCIFEVSYTQQLLAVPISAILTKCAYPN